MEVKMRQIEAITVNKWMAENPRMVRRLLNIEDCTSTEECIGIIDELQKQELEYLVPVLLYTTRYNDVIDAVMLRMNAEGIARTWELMGTEQMMMDIKNEIKDEIKLKEARK